MSTSPLNRSNAFLAAIALVANPANPPSNFFHGILEPFLSFVSSVDTCPAPGLPMELSFPLSLLSSRASRFFSLILFISDKNSDLKSSTCSSKSFCVFSLATTSERLFKALVVPPPNNPPIALNGAVAAEPAALVTPVASL